MLKISQKFCVLLIATLSFLMVSCIPFWKDRITQSPQIIQPQEVNRVINELPNYTELGYSGLVFFNDKLYVSSNVGLLEYNDGNLSRLYKWFGKDDVISGPWLNNLDNSLWCFHNGLQKLIRYDGATWTFVDLPQPNKGYNRGNVMNGFQGFSTSFAFWLQGADQSWQWNKISNSWFSEPMPERDCYFEPNDKNIRCYVSIAPVKEKVFTIMRRQFISNLEADFSTDKPNKTNSDVIYFLQDGNWKEFQNNSGIEFFTKKVISADNCVFILTSQSELLKLTESEITLIESLGEVENIAVTTTNNLLVSFRNNGIYEYNNGWEKKFSSPYQQNDSEYWTYLAESNGKIAIATTFMPNKDGKRSTRAALWISDKNQLKQVSVEE